MSGVAPVLVRVLLAVASLLSLVACVATVPPVAPAMGGLGVRDHADGWRGVSSDPSKPTAGVRSVYVTLVLAGEVGESEYRGSNDEILAARLNLQALINEVRAHRPATPLQSALLSSAQSMAESNMNLFVIPSTTCQPERVGQFCEFDYQLSRVYREVVREKVSTESALRRRLLGYGPFLVAMRSGSFARGLSAAAPSAEAEGDEAVVVMDLTGVNAKAIPIYLRAFRESLLDDGVVKTKEVRSLRGALVSRLLRLNDALPVVIGAAAAVPASALRDRK